MTESPQFILGTTGNKLNFASQIEPQRSSYTSITPTGDATPGQGITTDHMKSNGNFEEEKSQNAAISNTASESKIELASAGNINA